MTRRRTVLFACLLALVGCQNEKTPPAPNAGRPPALRIGLIPEQNIFRQIERYGPLKEYLAGKIGRDIELKVLPRYGNIVENFRSLGLDGAFFGSFTYALAHRMIAVEVIARPVWADNTSTYHGVIFARMDSGIRTAAQLRGKRFVFVDKATTAGYLLPLDYFRENRIADYRRFFRETWFAGTHEAAIRDVLDRRADAGAAKSTVYLRMGSMEPRIGKELVVLARSPEVPENALALRGDLDGVLRGKIRGALLGMADDRAGAEILGKFGARGFIPTTDADYAPVYEYARHVGIDLAAYDYVNE